MPGGARPSSTAGGDFDEDGDIDVAVANIGSRYVSLFAGNGSGGLQHRRNLDVGPTVRSVCVLDIGDLDGDGDLDLVTSSYESARFTIFRNDGSGNLAHARELSAPEAGSCTVLQERDDDDDLDIAGVDEERDVVVLFENP